MFEAQHQGIVKMKQERQDGGNTRLSITEESNSITAWDAEDFGKGSWVGVPQSANLSPYFVGANRLGSSRD